MNQLPSAVWVNVNPHFQGFDQPLLAELAKKMTIAEWQYYQTPDEPASLEVALVLLHDYLKHYDRPVHLLGHGNGGLISLLYGKRHPQRVNSLTLLSVGAYPAVDWQAHYYVQLNLLLCCRETLLTQTVHNLFGHQSRPITRKYRQLLEQDLLTSLSPHSLYQRVHISPESLPIPLLICRGQQDPVIDVNLWQQWQPFLKESDRLWECPQGRYFFHYAYPQTVSQQIQQFWQSLPFFPYSPCLLQLDRD